MKVVHIVVRNTSTLDYSIPYLCALREQYPDAEISVMFCMLNKKQVLRNAGYFDKTFEQFGIKQYDFIDFSSLPFGWLKKLCHHFFSLAYYDNVSLKNYLKNPFFMRGKSVKYILAGLRKKIDQWLCANKTNTAQIMDFFDPDLILFDHRARIDFAGRQDFYAWFSKHKKPIVLVPHAAHPGDALDEYSPFGLDGEEEFPAYCDHWSSHTPATPYLKVSEAQRSQFSMVGHPGLDSRWFSTMKNQTDETGPSTVFRALVMTRKFLPQGWKRPEGMDPGVVEFEDVVRSIKLIDAALKKTNKPYEIIIKPHPSGSYPENIRILQLAGVNHARVTYEPFFELLPRADLVITEFTTSIAFPVLYRIPIILLNSSVQQWLHTLWDKLEALYEGMQFYIEPEDLAVTIGQIVDDVNGDRSMVTRACELDVQHFRGFYEDDAIKRALIRTERLVGAKNDAKAASVNHQVS